MLCISFLFLSFFAYFLDFIDEFGYRIQYLYINLNFSNQARALFRTQASMIKVRWARAYFVIFEPSLSPVKFVLITTLVWSKLHKL